MTSGYPDWTRTVQPRKSDAGSDQSMLWWTSYVEVSADSMATIDITTVDEGKKLILYAYDVSSQTANNFTAGLGYGGHKVHLITLTSSDRNKQILFPDGSITVSSGNTLKFYLENEDSSNSHLFLYNIMGVEVPA